MYNRNKIEKENYEKRKHIINSKKMQVLDIIIIGVIPISIVLLAFFSWDNWQIMSEDLICHECGEMLKTPLQKHTFEDCKKWKAKLVNKSITIDELRKKILINIMDYVNKTGLMNQRSMDIIIHDTCKPYAGHGSIDFLIRDKPLVSWDE